jgi:hypothetical protein
MLLGISLLENRYLDEVDDIDHRPIYGCMSYSEYIMNSIWEQALRSMVTLNTIRFKQTEEWLKNRESWLVNYPNKPIRIVTAERMKLPEDK